MNLRPFVNRIKRRAGYGSTTDEEDQATSDIIDAANDIFALIWREDDWWWSLNERTVTLVAGTSDYTLEATDGDIFTIDPGGGADPLKRFRLKEYLKWYKGSDTADKGEVIGYIPIGRDSNDKLKFRIVHTPTASGSLTVWCKKRFTEVAVSDLTANARIPYFPNDVHELAVRGVEALVKKIMGKTIEAAEEMRRFDRDLIKLSENEKNEPDAQITVPLPDLIRGRKRKRGGTTVA